MTAAQCGRQCQLQVQEKVLSGQDHVVQLEHQVVLLVAQQACLLEISRELHRAQSSEIELGQQT